MKVVKRVPPGMVIATAMKRLWTKLPANYWRTKRKTTRLHMMKEGSEYFSAEEHAFWAPGEMPTWDIVQTGPKSFKLVR